MCDSIHKEIDTMRKKVSFSKGGMNCYPSDFKMLFIIAIVLEKHFSRKLLAWI